MKGNQKGQQVVKDNQSSQPPKGNPSDQISQRKNGGSSPKSSTTMNSNGENKTSGKEYSDNEYEYESESPIARKNRLDEIQANSRNKNSSRNL